MKHHTSILIFLVSFAMFMFFLSQPTKHIVAAKVDSLAISQIEVRSAADSIGLVIPAIVKTSITTTQDFKTYLLATFGSFLTVILMALLKFFFPQVFGKVNP